MALQVQLDFFETEEQSQIKAFENKIDEMDASLHKIRKKLFAENGSLKKRCTDLEERLEILERNICKKEIV